MADQDSKFQGESAAQAQTLLLRYADPLHSVVQRKYLDHILTKSQIGMIKFRHVNKL